MSSDAERVVSSVGEKSNGSSSNVVSGNHVRDL